MNKRKTITNKTELMAYNALLAKRKAKQEELIHKYFTRIPMHWKRNKDGYLYNNEEAYDAIDYYMETGIEP